MKRKIFTGLMIWEVVAFSMIAAAYLLVTDADSAESDDFQVTTSHYSTFKHAGYDYPTDSTLKTTTGAEK